jgi:hypothetical protein
MSACRLRKHGQEAHGFRISDVVLTADRRPTRKELETKDVSANGRCHVKPPPKLHTKCRA